MWNRPLSRSRRHGGGAALVLACLMSAAMPRIAAGQEPPPQAGADDPQDTQEVATTTRSFFSALGHNLVDDLKHIPRRNSLYWAVGGGAAALAVHPADKSLNRRLAGSDEWDAFFKPGKYIGSTEVQVGAALTTYVIGRVNGSNRVRHLGMDLIEADLLSEGVVEVLKVSVRRPRPPNPDGTPNSAHTFSFPSGHAAITFAGATVLQQHLGWKAAVPTYAIASYVAISRMHDNRHYFSDVVFGAATGVIIGRSVTWHGRNNYPIMPAVGPNYVGATMIW
jgi:PAP2 superfamily protein